MNFQAMLFGPVMVPALVLFILLPPAPSGVFETFPIGV